MASENRQEKSYTTTSLLDEAVQNIVTADHEHRAGVEVAAALLYATILENKNIQSRDLPRYAQLPRIANTAGFIENGIYTITALNNSAVNGAVSLYNTVAALPQSMQKGMEYIKSGQVIADTVIGVANHMNKAKHPIDTSLAAAEYAYHAYKGDGGNMNMEERKALAVLYHQPQADRLVALKTAEWASFEKAALITVVSKIAIDTPVALQRAGNTLKATAAGLAPQAEFAAPGVGAMNMGADAAETNKAKATMMQSTDTTKQVVTKISQQSLIPTPIEAVSSEAAKRDVMATAALLNAIKQEMLILDEEITRDLAQQFNMAPRDVKWAREHQSERWLGKTEADFKSGEFNAINDMLNTYHPNMKDLSSLKTVQQYLPTILDEKLAKLPEMVIADRLDLASIEVDILVGNRVRAMGYSREAFRNLSETETRTAQKQINEDPTIIRLVQLREDAALKYIEAMDKRHALEDQLLLPKNLHLTRAEIDQNINAVHDRISMVTKDNSREVNPNMEPAMRRVAQTTHVIDHEATQPPAIELRQDSLQR